MLDIEKLKTDLDYMSVLSRDISKKAWMKSSLKGNADNIYNRIQEILKEIEVVEKAKEY